MRLISWNVNGVRAAMNKGFLDFLRATNPDVLCLQETKANGEQVAHFDWPADYHQYWHGAEKLGYSGTAILSREKPVKVSYGIGKEDHDREGRVITAEFKDYFVVNVYVPNAQDGLRRLEYRTKHWEPDFLAYLKKLEKKKPVIVTGDFNVAHKEIDIARPKTNLRTPGFTIEERDCFSCLVDSGFIDTFREFNQEPGHYTWWSLRAGARARNVGWRIDYFLVSRKLRPRLKEAWIMPEIMGSDHCPVGITVE